MKKPRKKIKDGVELFVEESRNFVMIDKKSFLEALSLRMRKENDLSDITYAMCESNIVFRQFFLDFFFPFAHLIAEKVEIAREHSHALGRPDFWITRRDTGEVFIVEVKIWDGNHHFDQYFGILRDRNNGCADFDSVCVWQHLGYIANYEINEANGKSIVDLGCNVTTWMKFVNRLEQYHSFNDSLIESYVRYVKAVCPFDAFNVDDYLLNADDFKKVRSLTQDIEAAIEVSDRCHRYNGSTRYFYSQYRMGRFFSLAIDDDRTAWGWFGVYYLASGVSICIEFEDRDGWGRIVCDEYRDNVKDNCLRFYRNDKTDIVEFFCSTIESVLRHIQGKESSIHNFTEYASEDYKQVLSMKALPFALEKEFFHKPRKYQFGEDLYKLRLTYEADQESMDSHCGRYFELVKDCDGVPEEHQPRLKGWIGCIYNDKMKNGRGANMGECPTMVLEVDKPLVENMLGVTLDSHPQDGGWYADGFGWACRDIECSSVRFNEIFSAIGNAFDAFRNIRKNSTEGK